jgi:hypothetical protein
MNDPRLAPTAQRLLDELAPHTPFAEAIVRRQAERAGLRLEELTDAHLPHIVPLIVAASSAFVDPHVLARLRKMVK